MASEDLGHQSQELVGHGCLPGTDAEVSRIRDKIIQLAEQGIHTSGYAFLSRVGNDLGDDIAVLKARTGKKLADFVSTELGDRYEVRSPPNYGSGVLAIYRVGSEMPETVTEQPTPAPADDQFRYHYRFWAAFAVPPKGPQRLLNTRDFTFQDGDGSERDSEETAVITGDYLTDEHADNRDALVRSNIERWLRQHGWPKDRVAANRRLGVSAPLKTGGTRTVLHAVVEALDRRQLQNLNLPMDVVAALLYART